MTAFVKEEYRAKCIKIIQHIINRLKSDYTTYKINSFGSSNREEFSINFFGSHIGWEISTLLYPIPEIKIGYLKLEAPNNLCVAFFNILRESYFKQCKDLNKKMEECGNKNLGDLLAYTYIKDETNEK